MNVRVVIDHVGGARRGQRQELDAGKRIRFGRHPDCEVSFDAHRDIDASSRHAELRGVDNGWVLVDLGSSNGTYVDGKRVTEAPVAQNTALDLQFGPGGPRVRLFVGDETAIENLPPVVVEKTRPTWLGPAIGGAFILVVLVLLVTHC
jgi:pSer/pThr/pTyr-binding forkhead associated (FHA) protein